MANDRWRTQPRVPRGSEAGGEWTDDPKWAVRAATQLGAKIAQGGGAPLQGESGFRKIRDQQATRLAATVGQSEAVDTYGSNSAYIAVQSLARGYDGAPVNTPARRRAAKAIQGMDELFATNGVILDEPVQVWRGITDAPSVFPGGIGGGDEFRDDGYQSLSFNPVHAKSFARDAGYANGALFKVSLKPGQRALLLQSVASQFREASGAEQERELVLPRGTSYRIVRRLEDTDSGLGSKLPTYEVEAVDTPASHPLPDSVATYLGRARATARTVAVAGEGVRDFKTSKWWPYLGRGQDPSDAVQIMRKMLRENHRVVDGLLLGNYHRLSAQERNVVARQMNVTVATIDRLIKKQDK